MGPRAAQPRESARQLTAHSRSISEKQRIIAENGTVVLDSLPENDEAAGELLELLVDCGLKAVRAPASS